MWVWEHCTVHKVRTYKEYHSVFPSSELGLSQPLSRQRVFPSPQKQGGGGTLACGWGVGASPNSDEGRTLWYSLYVRTLWYSIYGGEYRVHRRYDMNGRSQMQGGKNWILPKELNTNHSSETLIGWKLEKNLCLSMWPNGGSVGCVTMDSGWEGVEGDYAMKSVIIVIAST